MILEHMFPLRESMKNKQPFRKNPNYLPQVVLGLEKVLQAVQKCLRI